MRALLLALFLLFPASVSAQASLGTPLYPMLLIDESQLGSQFERAVYPRAPWDDAKACLSELGYKTPSDFTPPELVIIPRGIASIRVGDLVRDSLYPGVTHFAPPTYAYALIRSDKVLILEVVRSSYRVLRHEALHGLLWASARKYGHPMDVFLICDRERPIPAS